MFSNQYIALFRIVAFRKLLLRYSASHLTASAAYLLLIATATTAHQPSWLSGLVAGAYSLGFALACSCWPLIASRLGQRRALFQCGLCLPALLTAFAIVVDAPSTAGWLCVIAWCAGVTTPPLAAIARTNWPTLVADPQLVIPAFTLHGALLGAFGVLCPLLVALSATAVGPTGSCYLCAVCLFLGVSTFAAMQDKHDGKIDARTSAEDTETGHSRLSESMIYAVLFVIYGAYGDLEVASIRAFPAGGYSILLASWAIGGIVGAAAVGLSRHKGMPWRAARVLVPAGAGIILVDSMLRSDLLDSVIALFLFGCVMTPGVALILARISAAGGTATATVYSRVSAVTWIGTAVGATLPADFESDQVTRCAGLSAGCLIALGCAGLWKWR